MIGYSCHMMMVTFIRVFCTTYFGGVPASSVSNLLRIMWLGAVAVRVRLYAYVLFNSNDHISSVVQYCAVFIGQVHCSRLLEKM